MNSAAASVKFHRRISQFVFKEMETLEFGSREDIVSFGEWVYTSLTPWTLSDLSYFPVLCWLLGSSK